MSDPESKTPPVKVVESEMPGEDVGKGDHVLEAYDVDTGDLVEKDQIDLNKHEDYTWTIEECD